LVAKFEEEREQEKMNRYGYVIGIGMALFVAGIVVVGGSILIYVFELPLILYYIIRLLGAALLSSGVLVMFTVAELDIDILLASSPRVRTVLAFAMTGVSISWGLNRPYLHMLGALPMIRLAIPCGFHGEHFGCLQSACCAPFVRRLCAVCRNRRPMFVGAFSRTLSHW
jgi:hypothetical protein